MTPRRQRDYKAEYARRPPRPRRNGYGRWDLLIWFTQHERILTRDELGTALYHDWMHRGAMVGPAS